MALVLKDRAKETCTGTSGTMTLAGAVSGFVAFSVIGNAKDRDSSTLIEILVDPDVGVPGYESWWDVPVAEISTSSSVTEARLKYEKNILGEKDL